MGRINPYTLQMQITKMFEQGQSFFALTKVNDWLTERKENPADYEVIFHRQEAPTVTGLTLNILIELKRKDGKEVDPWLQEEINRCQ
jgi:hypothetical protein